jgi:dihydrodipicolinate synthase/N-acetylneuraminate lyase
LSLSGSITALATPFTVAGDLDPDAWRRLLQQQLDGGTQGVVVAGSTGEAAALTDAEYDLLLETAVEAVAGRIPVLAGTGQMNTAKTIAQTRRAAAAGADLALVVTPPYVRPTQAGLIAHFNAVADQGGKLGVAADGGNKTYEVGCALDRDVDRALGFEQTVCNLLGQLSALLEHDVPLRALGRG